MDVLEGLERGSVREWREESWELREEKAEVRAGWEEGR